MVANQSEWNFLKQSGNSKFAVEKFREQWSAKKRMLPNFKNVKKPILVDLFLKVPTVNSIFCCQILSQYSPYLSKVIHIIKSVFSYFLEFFFSCVIFLYQEYIRKR